jgi:hypothetical protein
LGPNQTATFAQVYRFLKPGEIDAGTDHPIIAEAWQLARSESF